MALMRSASGRRVSKNGFVAAGCASSNSTGAAKTMAKTGARSNVRWLRMRTLLIRNIVVAESQSIRGEESAEVVDHVPRVRHAPGGRPEVLLRRGGERRHGNGRHAERDVRPARHGLVRRTRRAPRTARRTVPRPHAVLQVRALAPVDHARVVEVAVVVVMLRRGE